MNAAANLLENGIWPDHDISFMYIRVRLENILLLQGHTDKGDQKRLQFPQKNHD